MYTSIGIRFEANVDALNMAETAGNYTKHRRVPYLVRDEEENKYKSLYVPALSGESLGHGFQALLVREAKNHYQDKAPVCEKCAQNEFFKSMNWKNLEPKLKALDIKKSQKDLTPEDIEAIVLKACLIEDIGGYMYAEKPPVKRTSAFQVSYALPIKSAVHYATTEPQLHARHAQMTGKEKKGETSEQMIYYIETGSAIYGFTFNIDLGIIGKSTLGQSEILKEKQRKERQEIALKALMRMLSSQQFGAKLSRFFPVGSILTVAATITKGPFSITSPIYDGYITKSHNRLKIYNETFPEEKATLVISTTGNEQGESLAEDDISTQVATPEAVIKTILDRLKQD
ncbi:MAG: type I-A CRISPR-associated protein Cas7/Csa2 [Candidatus Heimdallarchaeota archaeon]|nr:type I-A CRISPR-associated protein Cas7/Csa2 [Candidatus Heimdallarchaeota archaeon]